MPSRQELDKARKWLGDNPPNGKNRGERRERMDVIQAACDALDDRVYHRYKKSWGEDEDKVRALEAQHPALYYLREATKEAVRQIRTTRVKQGVVVWHIYNMGYVFKTPDACFGIDISMPRSEELADELDFLLITHEHGDHWAEPLIKAMLKVKKPVITRWKPGTTIVNKPCNFQFGKVRVKIDIGDHAHPKRTNDMLMYQVDCGKAANNFTIYHSGDGNNVAKMRPDKAIDVFIVHVQNGMSIDKAIGHVKPQLTLLSHVMELEHRSKPPHAWRWSFKYSFGRIQNFPADKATILTWGERWLAPNTKL